MERRPQRVSNPTGLVPQLTIREGEHRVARNLEASELRVVALECLTVAMMLPALELDHQPHPRPQASTRKPSTRAFTWGRGSPLSRIRSRNLDSRSDFDSIAVVGS
jgi:hypothetical protein